MRLIAIVFLIVTSGCTSITTELAHTSHPFAGPPFGPVSEEDSLNSLNLCAQRERSRWYIEQCVGYVYTDGGFFGPKLIWQGRIGRKWSLREH
jgi:hypothetical protein